MDKLLQKKLILRRQNLAKTMVDNSVAILCAAEEIARNADAYYRFRQNSNFYYITGINEANIILLLIKDDLHHYRYILFVSKQDQVAAQWVGKKIDLEIAKNIYAADEAYYLDELHGILKNSIGKHNNALYYAFTQNKQLNQILQNIYNELVCAARQGYKQPQIIYNLDNILANMRLIKDDYEISCLQQAAKISAAAHKHIMQNIASFDSEYQIEAEFKHFIGKYNLLEQAYPCIAGAGKNSCILHYQQNNQKFCSTDLLLIDAGGEYQNYAADITRTFPINGSFSSRQRDIYQLVLEAQKEGISHAIAGNLWTDIQMKILEIIVAGLIDLRLLSGNISDIIVNKKYLPFYMHNSGHWLGLDVHDVGAYKNNNQWQQLRAGMVLTVEPGIYIGEHMNNIDSSWHNIGVRIEDDILITETSNINLSIDAPKEIADIEQIING